MLPQSGAVWSRRPGQQDGVMDEAHNNRVVVDRIASPRIGGFGAGVSVEVWRARHSLVGRAVDSGHAPPLRARVVRDAYDFQSYASVEVWSDHGGWMQLDRLPIDRISVVAHSPAAHDGRWEDSMRSDLQSLIAHGRSFFASRR
jgi:hypothetical protein